MKKTLMVVGIGLALVFLMGTVLPDMAAAQQQAQFKWRMATLYPRASYGLTYPTFADARKKMSGGRLEVTIVYDGEGIPATEVLNAVRTGLAEMGQPYQALRAGEFPAGVVEIGLPGGPDNIIELRALFHEGGWDKIMKKAYATQNAMWVWEMPQPATYLLTKKPINKLDDLKKLKIRCPGAYGRMMFHLGASPVTMAFAEVYSSLASGLIDGVDGCNLPDHEGGKFYEQAKYLYPLPLSGAQISSVIVNLSAWNKLPDDLKGIVVGAASLLGDDQQNKTGLWEKESLAKMLAKGVKWSPAPSAADKQKWADAGRKVWDEYATKDQFCKELVEAQKAFMKRIGYQVK